MLRAMLYVQWKAARWLLAAMVLMTFAAPILATGTARLMAREGYSDAAGVLQLLEGVLPVFPFLAALTGFMVALASWEWDHRAGHVYALALPVSRSRYVLLRLSAGLVLLAAPVLAFWIGAFTAVLVTPLPETLRAYPFSFGFRFLLASLIAFMTAFALAAGTTRTVSRVLLGLAVFVVVGSVLVDFLGRVLGITWLVPPLDLLLWALVRWPGPFHVFGGSWMLIDV